MISLQSQCSPPHSYWLFQDTQNKLLLSEAPRVQSVIKIPENRLERPEDAATVVLKPALIIHLVLFSWMRFTSSSPLVDNMVALATVMWPHHFCPLVGPFENTPSISPVQTENSTNKTVSPLSELARVTNAKCIIFLCSQSGPRGRGRIVSVRGRTDYHKWFFRAMTVSPWYQT